MPYIGTQPKDVRSFGKVQFDFTATQGQTAFTGADDDGKTLGFTEGQIQVYVNGILMDASDYTTSNTNTVTLVSAANLNDIITVVALQTDIPNSDYVPISGGTFTGDVTFNGSIDGNVGIGTSSPAGVLSLKKSTRTLDIKLADTPASGEYGVQFTAGSGDYLGFGAGGSGTAIAIDSSNRVTLPYQPSFNVYQNANLSLTASVWTQNVNLNTARHNVGNHFNTSNGSFTAPVNGSYLLSYTAHFSSNTNTYFYMGMKVNGNFHVYFFGFNDAVAGGDNTFSGSGVFYLNANDVVTFWNYDSNGGVLGSSAVRTNASGFLLG